MDSPTFYDGANYEYGTGAGFWLKRAVSSLTWTIERDMAEHGLTDAQWLPLFALSKTDYKTATDLARIVNYDAGAMTRLIDRLEAKGLVRRARSTDDRRVVNLELTDEGSRVADMIPFVIAGVLNNQMRGFSQSEHDILVTLLKRLVANGDPRFCEAVPSICAVAAEQSKEPR
jgi:DNA-binding MarR family transcriptional regulator